MSKINPRILRAARDTLTRTLGSRRTPEAIADAYRAAAGEHVVSVADLDAQIAEWYPSLGIPRWDVNAPAKWERASGRPSIQEVHRLARVELGRRATEEARLKERSLGQLSKTLGSNTATTAKALREAGWTVPAEANGRWRVVLVREAA